MTVILIRKCVNLLFIDNLLQNGAQKVTEYHSFA